MPPVAGPAIATIRAVNRTRPCRRLSARCVRLELMDGRIGSGSVGLGKRAWRRPPWNIPPGRRDPLWRGLPEALAFGALMFSWFGAAAMVYEPRSYQVGYYIAVVVAVSYGVATIVFARRRELKPVVRVGFTTNPGAARWYGLAYVVPALLGLSVALFLYPRSAAPWDQARFTIAFWAAPTAYGVFLMVARMRSNRAVRQAIVTGVAPSFATSPVGGCWWWDGTAWVNAHDAAPNSALRSPDGNYWWTGSAWFAMPPRVAERSSGLQEGAVPRVNGG